MKSGGNQQRHFNPRVAYNHMNQLQTPVVVQQLQLQPPPQQQQQQPQLYSRNQAYLSHPVDMPPVGEFN